MSVHKSGREWIVTDKSGRQILGRHPSKAKADEQLRAIEANKHKGK